MAARERDKRGQVTGERAGFGGDRGESAFSEVQFELVRKHPPLPDRPGWTVSAASAYHSVSPRNRSASGVPTAAGWRFEAEFR